MTSAEDVGDAIIVCGSGVLGTWVADFIREAYSLSEHPVEVQSSEGDPACADLGREAGPPRALLVAGPGRQAMEAISTRRVPTIAVLDDPVDIVRVAMADGTSLPNVLRRQTRLTAGHHLLLDNPAVTFVNRGDVKPARVLLAALMADLRLVVRSEAEAALLDRHAGGEDEHLSLEEALARRVPHHLRLDRLHEQVPAEVVSAVRQVLSPMVLGAVQRDIGPITWVSRMFLFGDTPDQAPPPIADVTGGVRVLYYGPYFHLPPGEWTARVVLAFSPELKGLAMKLLVLAGARVIAKVRFNATEAGAFEGTFTLRHVDADQFVEIQLINDEGILEGHMALGQLRFTRTRWLGATVDHKDE